MTDSGIELLSALGILARMPHLRRSVKPATKCRLPDCTRTTTHNGGYCSAAHCKLHRQRLKEGKK